LNQITEQLLPLAVDLKKLVPATSNPRRGDIDAIKKSYERFGQRKPIVALKGSSEIIAGNHQYQAALDLGWDKIAVVFVEDDAETATAYSIADNRIGQLGEWNVEELVLAFEKIDFADFDATGFSENDVEDFRALLDEQAMTMPAIAPLDGHLTQTGQVQEDPQMTVKKDATYAEFLERYANRAVRAIILYYPNDTYGTMVENLDKLSKQLGTNDNAETIELLVKEKLS
jgi:hypothetical protein